MSGIFKEGRRTEVNSDKWVTLLEDNLKTTMRPSRLNIFGSNAGQCSRQTAGMILVDKSHTVENGASTQFYFKIGNAFEKVVKQAFTKSGMTFIDEFRIEERLTPHTPSVSGRIDFLVQDDNTEEMTLIELKSCGKLPDKPKPAHVAQLKTYLFLTGASHGVLFYISRNVANFKGELQAIAFDIKPTTDEFVEVGLEIAIGALGASTDILPQIPDHMKKYKCGFCPLVNFCWDNQAINMRGELADDLQQVNLEHEAHKIVEEYMIERPKKLKELKQRFKDELGLIW